MTHEEQVKLYEDLKNWFIEKHGYRFLKMSEENQHKLIISYIQSYVDKLKIENK